MRFEIKGEYTRFLGDWTVMLLLPAVEIDFGAKSEDKFHVSFPTQILYRRPKNGWQWHWSFVFRVSGVGFGVAHQHSQNPNWSKKAREQNLECSK